MKNVYLLTILYLQNSICTIDISIPEYQYLSQCLTREECRRLYTSLHFTTFDLPTAEKKVPNLSCLQLLTKWDKGTGKAEGKSKSHVDVVRRLRQIGRDDLADWLSASVLTKLAEEANEALNTNFSNNTEKVQGKVKKGVINDWTLYDVTMWSVFAGLVISVVLIFGRIIAICCTKKVLRKKAKEEEIMELLSYGSLDSDQETIYECVLKSNQVGDDKMDE